MDRVKRDGKRREEEKVKKRGKSQKKESRALEREKTAKGGPSSLKKSLVQIYGNENEKKRRETRGRPCREVQSEKRSESGVGSNDAV